MSRSAVIQGKAITQVIEKGERLFITKAAHLTAYSRYAQANGTDISAEEMDALGGFTKEQLDAFCPRWREHIHQDSFESGCLNMSTPVFIPAGDPRVLINGHPPKVDCRIVAECLYQRLIANFKEKV